MKHITWNAHDHLRRHLLNAIIVSSRETAQFPEHLSAYSHILESKACLSPGQHQGRVKSHHVSFNLLARLRIS